MAKITNEYPGWSGQWVVEEAPGKVLRDPDGAVVTVAGETAEAREADLKRQQEGWPKKGKP